jgi:hypothetical protein
VLSAQAHSWIFDVLKNSSKTRFPSGEFLPVGVFLAVVCSLRGCHCWLRSHVEEPHQSFQVLRIGFTVLQFFLSVLFPGLRIKVPEDPDYDPSGTYADHFYLHTVAIPFADLTCC